MLRRRMEGITESWACDIEYWLEGFLDYVNWELDETKTFHYHEHLKKKYSTSSYRKRVYQIKRFLQHHHIKWDRHIQPPAEPTKLPKHITSDIIQDTLTFFKDHPYEQQMKAIIHLGASSGMQPEEMYQLTPKDIDLHQCLVRIHHNPDNQQTVKTGRSRITFFNSQAQQTFQEYLRFYNNGCGLTYFFGKKHIQHTFNSAPIQVKDLRKYFSQQWDHNGGPTSIKNMLMGHSDDVDRLHYNHQNINDLKQIYNKIMVSNIF